MPIDFSLEVFPPKTEAGIGRLMETVALYSALNPAFISVTFGAGGSASDVELARTVSRRLRASFATPVAAHITCAGREKSKVDDTIEEFWQDGIRHFVALRGDIPRNDQGGEHTSGYLPHPNGYAWTSDFITALRVKYPSMRIAVAGYPEGHPESPSTASDIDNLQRKVDAGADEVITQFFFDPEVFLRWRDRVSARGIAVPLVPGLLPILNFPRMLIFAERCQASVPQFLHTMFAGVDPDSLDSRLLAMNVLAHQITRLIDNGITRFHFYTLNETLLTRHLATWLRAGF